MGLRDVFPNVSTVVIFVSYMALFINLGLHPWYTHDAVSCVHRTYPSRDPL